MLSALLVTIIIALALYKAYKWMFWRPPNFPPGPPRLPFVGSYLFLLLLDYKFVYPAVIKLCKFYKTQVLGFFIGPAPVIYVHDYEGAKEILRRQEFDGKESRLFLVQMRHPEFKSHGVFFTDGSVWKNQRWFMLRYLRDYGFGRRHDNFELDCHDEIRDFITMIRDGPKYPHEHRFMKDGHVLAPMFLATTSFNCFLHCLLGYRYARADQEWFVDLCEQVIEFTRNTHPYGLIISVIPWIRHFFPKSTRYETLRKLNKFIFANSKKIIDQQVKSYDPKFERNIIDMYINEMQSIEGKEKDIRGFNYDQFIFNISDFTIPAISAVSSTISLLMHRGIQHPEVVKKMQAEIDEVVGQGRIPTLNDRVNLPYTEALLRESMRFDTLLPASLPHRAMEATTFRGYDIPEGAGVFIGPEAFHMDKEIWGDPEKFRPERFLDETTGKLSVKMDKSLPFGAGRRLCPGETFSRNMAFLYLAAIYQNFTPQLAPSDRVENMIKNQKVGFIRTPTDYWVKLVPR